MKSLAVFLHRFSAGLLLVALVMAPWLLGSLPPVAIQLILAVLLGASVCWMGGLILARRRPVVGWASLLGAVLLVQGWLMTAHPIAEFNAITGEILPLMRANPRMPGSIDAYSSFLGMRSFTVLFLVFHVALDHLRSVAFRRKLLWTAAFTGASVALLGVAQRLGSTFLLDLQPAFEGAPFGPFGYHGNAGSFLLLTLPAAVVLAVDAWMARRRGLAALGAFLAVMILAGDVSNTARATVAILTLLMLILGGAIWGILSRALSRERRTLLTAVGAGVLCVGLAVSFVVMRKKWSELPGQFAAHSSRVVLWQVVGDLAREAGVFGNGPGTYPVLFLTAPRLHMLDGLFIYVQHIPGGRVSMWNNAHNDLLQAVVEWGWFGGAVWLVLGVGTIVAGWRAVAREPADSQRLLLLAPTAALLVVSVHAMVDYPFQVLAIQLYAVVYGALIWAGGKGREAGGA